MRALGPGQDAFGHQDRGNDETADDERYDTVHALLEAHLGEMRIVILKRGEQVNGRARQVDEGQVQQVSQSQTCAWHFPAEAYEDEHAHHAEPEETELR